MKIKTGWQAKPIDFIALYTHGLMIGLITVYFFSKNLMHFATNKSLLLPKIARIMTEKEALKQLDQTSEQALLEALEFVRQEGTNKLLLKSIHVLQATQNKQIKNKCIALLEDLNQDESVEVLVEVLEQEEFSSIHPILLSACWKNGRNYSAYLPVFINHFIEQPFESAFDAFTVIEQQAINPNQASEALIALKEQQEKITEEKKALYQQLESLLNERL